MTPAPATIRFVRHLTLWLLCWLFIRYIQYGLYVQDSDRMLDIVSLICLSQIIAVFYLFGYVVFPRYLYRLRLLPLVAVTGLCYYGLYLSNFVAAYYLHEISRPNPAVPMFHTEQGWALFQQAGLLGCFTDGGAAFLGTINNVLNVIPILAVKLVRDLLRQRIQVSLLEQDTLALERNNLALERNNLRLELDLLRAQVNPHFLFNALNSIYGRVVDVNEPAADLVLRLSELMRYNLYEANVPTIALADEIAYIENYLSLERIRHASLVDVMFSAEEDGLAGYRIAPLILLWFVEQAFAHSLGSGTERGYVLVETLVEAGTFFFTVQHSIPPRQPHPTAGNADLSDIDRRLAGLYPGRHRLDISQTPTRYTVSLQLQLDPVVA